MKPIPRAAMPVVRVLRRDVKRPTRMPIAGPGDAPRWWDSGIEYCPMGLHLEASLPLPFDAATFPLASDRAVSAFGQWWDHLRRADIPAAMDAIWGPK